MLYKVNPKRSLLDEQTYTLVVSTIYLNRYINYPTSIELTEDQKFEYEDNRNYLSPYPVRDGITTYKFTKIMYEFGLFIVTLLKMVRKRASLQWPSGTVI